MDERISKMGPGRTRTRTHEPTNDRRSHKDLLDERISKMGPGRTRTRTHGTLPGNKPPAPNPEGTEMSSNIGWGSGSGQRTLRCPAVV